MRKEGEEEGLSWPESGGERDSLREEMGEEGLGEKERFASLKERQGAPGLEGRTQGWGQRSGASLSLHLQQGHTCEGWCWAHPGGTAAHLQEGPPIPPHLLGWQGPPLVVGDSGHSTLYPASSRVTWAAGSSGGGWRLSAPSSPGGSGSGPHVAALPGPDSGPWRRPRQRKP